MALAVKREGAAKGTVLVLMHFLGGSSREWDEVVVALGPEQGVLRIDLPGFGDSAVETGYTVEAMADAVGTAVAGLEEYVLVGHSMSGKVSAVLARRAQDAGDHRLRGLVLVAPSPPGPEPMTEEKRGGMIASLGGAAREDDLERARSYITKNEQRDIEKSVELRAAQEVLRMNRTAWVAWLTQGSKEDWAERVGVLALPAIVVAGEKDSSLGPDAQREHTLPHLGAGRIHVVKGCSHLVPMERPVELAGLLREFVRTLPERPVVPAEYRELIVSERVSEPTWAVLERRMAGPPRADGVLTAEQERTLRAVMARVIPQEGTAQVDVAGTVLARLASGKGDGWRFAALPEDAEAYRNGLDALAKDGFADAGVEEQNAMLKRLAKKKGSAEARWFEEVRGDAVAAYMAHPATMARVGFSGVGVGGAETPNRGFVRVGVDEREDWEPLPTAQTGGAR